MALTIPQGLRIINSNPIDDRMIAATVADALANISKPRRHKGLRVFITSESKEYWFRDGITNADFIQYNPYPSLMIADSIETRDAIPESIRVEGMEVNVVSGNEFTKYVLLGGLTNDCWKEQNMGGDIHWNVIASLFYTPPTDDGMDFSSMTA